jgi:hypothetical protein
MIEEQKLDAGQRHVLGLIARDKKEDGWTVVSKQLYKALSSNMPPELATFEMYEDGSGRAKLTDQGQSVIDAMAWL